MSFGRGWIAVGTVAVLVGGLAIVVPASAGAAASTAATVRTARGPVIARSGASTVDRAVRRIASGVRLPVRCQVYGQLVRGTERRSAHWLRLVDDAFVPDAFVRWSPRRPAVAWCTRFGPTAATVRSSGRLSVRAAPRSSGRRVGSVAPGARVHVGCQAWGQRVAGPVRTSKVWYRIGRGRHIPAAFVAWRPALPVMPYCGQGPATVPAATPAAFVRRVGPPARASQRRYEVPASVTIAQAILESGWGRSNLTRREHNYFGIKCFGEPGPLAVGCRKYRTSECAGNDCYRTTAQFRVYRVPSASFADHGYFLRSRPRYRPAFRYTRQPDNFARAIHKAGYATSPRYARSLIAIMRRYDLYRYDG